MGVPEAQHRCETSHNGSSDASFPVTRILGAAEAVLSTIGMQLEPAEDAEFRRAAETIRAQLDPAAFGTAWAEGRMMTLEEAIKYALAAEAN